MTVWRWDFLKPKNPYLTPRAPEPLPPPDIPETVVDLADAEAISQISVSTGHRGDAAKRAARNAADRARRAARRASR